MRSRDSQTFRCVNPSFMTTFKVRLPGSVRSSDRLLRQEGRAVSDKKIPEDAVGGVTRREALVKAGVVAAGAVAAGSIAGTAKAAAGKKETFSTSKVKYGGKLTWALEQDPVHVAPFGAILTSNHWGKAPMYESLLEWDAKLNEHPALAESWKVIDNKTIDFHLRKG